jgi:hypothetical protein
MAMVAVKREVEEEDAGPAQGHEELSPRTSFIPGLTSGVLRQLIPPDGRVMQYVAEAESIATRAVLMPEKRLPPISEGPVRGWAYQLFSPNRGLLEVGFGESVAGGHLVASCSCSFGRPGKWCCHKYAIGFLHIDQEAEVWKKEG